MEKILISEDSIKQNTLIQGIKYFCNRVNQILPEFESETGYVLSIEEVRMLFFNSNDLTPLVEKVNKSVLKSFGEIKMTGIIKKTILPNYAEFIYSFANKLKPFLSNYGADYLQSNLCFENGKLTLSLEDEEKIREQFRIYITSEQGKEFYEKHKEICKILSEFSNYVKEKTGRMFDKDGLSIYYFDYSLEPCEILPIKMDYETALKKEWQNLPSWKR